MEELNLCELLKDCKGEEFYSLMHGKVRFMAISAEGFVMFDSPENISVYDNGKYDLNAEVIIYPSRALYEKYPLDAKKAWSIWASESKPKRWRADKNKSAYFITNEYEIDSIRDDYSDICNTLYNSGNYFRTKEEAHQAAEAVKECLKKFHEENTEQ